MTTEKLNQVRYRVIAKYPNCNWKIGEILLRGFSSISLEDYPHLFKKIEWWEDRKKEDLPKYVKRKSTGVIFEVKFYGDEPMYAYAVVAGNTTLVANVIPATEEEFVLAVAGSDLKPNSSGGILP